MTYINPRSKLYHHLDKVHDLRRGRVSAPVNVEIDLSNRCNLGCFGCHFAHTHTRGPLANTARLEQHLPGGDVMDTQLARRILDELADYGIKSVTWTGGGEPTLHRSFDSIIDYAGIVGLEQGIYTNGTQITPGRALLMKRALEWVYVSLDECTAESYQVSKKVDAFDKASAGIRNLVNAPGAAVIGIGFLLHAGNFRQIEDMVQLSRQLGADYCQFRPMIEFDPDDPSFILGETGWIDELRSCLWEYENAEDVIADPARFQMYRTWAGHEYKTCHWSRLQTVITPNGKVWACVNKREVPEACMGDLTTQRFAEIWASYQALPVNDKCRVMCRGHLANVELDKLMQPAEHVNFI